MTIKYPRLGQFAGATVFVIIDVLGCTVQLFVTTRHTNDAKEEWD